MNIAFQGERTVVSRAVLRGRGLDPVTARLRLSSALSGIELTPASASPIVIVRKLSSSLPRRILDGPGGVASPIEWERSLRDMLGSKLACAARPARGAVAAGVDAVVFADESEFLACLCRDWAEGRCDGWWWRALFPRGVDEAQVLRSLREYAAAVPRALRMLSESGFAVRFLERIDPSSARAVALDMVVRFGLAEVRESLEGSARHEPSPRGAERSAAVAKSHRNDGPDRDREPPWRDWLPCTDIGALHTAHECLLGIALALAHAPQQVRRAAFARHLDRWLRRATRDDGTRGQALRIPSSGAAVAGPPVQPRDAGSAGTKDERRAAAPESRITTTVEGGRRGATRPGLTQAPAVKPDAESVRDARGERQAAAAVDLGADVIGAEWPEIETAFGGVFYLVNAALGLGLYGDFSQPLRPGLKLSVWDFLALTGDRLTQGRIRTDPVWRLLARLAERGHGEAPGKHFTPPPDWRVPVRWLMCFPRPAQWTWSAAHGRLRIEHPAGFAVVDVALRERDVAGLFEREMRVYRRAGLFEVVRRRRTGRKHRARPVGRLAHWLGLLVDYLSARLRLALAFPRRVDPGLEVCAHRARVAVRPTSIDVSMALDELPVAVRIAGLDRDPGWVPAAGRAIRFHFD